MKNFIEVLKELDSIKESFIKNGIQKIDCDTNEVLSAIASDITENTIKEIIIKAIDNKIETVDNFMQVLEEYVNELVEYRNSLVDEFFPIDRNDTDECESEHECSCNCKCSCESEKNEEPSKPETQFSCQYSINDEFFKFDPLDIEVFLCGVKR